MASNPDLEPRQTWRQEIVASLGSVKQLVSKSLSPIPADPYIPTNDPDKKKMTTFFQDLKKIGFNDVETLLNLLNSEIKGSQNDNKFLLENLVQLLAKLDDNSEISQKLTNGFINNLWNALPHPPLTSLGTKYKYREADGSYNNIRFPELGAANTPYARSAKPTILQNIALPDPGAIFDSLMARGDTFEPHPNKISSMLFYLATIIIHDIFRTDHTDFNNSMTSSYLDLAPLYGSTQAEQDSIRTFKDGRIKPDCFSEKRILGFPPGVGVMCIMFNRFHNYVVTNLANINENGRFNKPKADALKAAWTKYDNDLFQTGRLITCGLYVNCILKDYVRTILSLNRSGTKWDLDPRTEEGKTLFNAPAAEGTGNQVSAEFNLIYRWHSAVSEKDDKWTQGVYKQMFPGQNPEDVTLSELMKALKGMEAAIPDDPVQRPFASLKRGDDGNFSDDDLVEILGSSISDVAGSFGANRVPKILRSVDILGIIQARYWNLASLNEFREFSGLTKHATFEDINPDPIVAQKLKNLYDHPDHVELYPGLVAEKAKPPISPGSGLCVNFTTSYSILSDAVGLVRGDRFYTIDYTPKNLTNWGYNEVQYDSAVDDGCVFYKLILGAFPNHFKPNSIYAHFPLVIPAENLVIQKSLNRAQNYSWEKPSRNAVPKVVTSYAEAKKILDDKVTWVSTSDPINVLTTSPPKTSKKSATVSVQSLKQSLSADWKSDVESFYTNTTFALLNKYSFSIPGSKTAAQQVDIIRDITNLVNTRFAAALFSLPIKTEEFPLGVYTEQELYQVLAIMETVLDGNVDVGKAFQLVEASKLLGQQLGDVVVLDVEDVERTGWVAGLVEKLHAKSEVGELGTNLIKELVKGSGVEQLVWGQILPSAAAISANQSKIFSQVVDFYLTTGAKHLSELYTLSKAGTKDADASILKYIQEATRLSTTTKIILSSTTSKAPQTVILDLSAASADSSGITSASSFDANRPASTYLTAAPSSPLEAITQEIGDVAMVSIAKVIFGLKNLRRASGTYYHGWQSPGNLYSVAGEDGLKKYLSEDWSSFSPFPATMKVQWDGA